MSQGDSRKSDLPPRRLLWLFGVKIVLMVFAALVALRLYGLI
ncbi:hypothetical protein [Alsobacter ponti]|nr:hypothetical protein [Alsobacter ponti]